MTEAEAKTKVCCGPRSGIQYFPMTSTLVGAESSASLCIASHCMAWRMMVVRGKLQTHPASEQSPGPGWKRGLGMTDGMWFKEGEDALEGFCGLAGAPQ